MNWKSNYKLPVNFILFYILMFFLLGEQLPALSPYVFGPHEGDAIHILARAPSDALHRPIAYLIIATIVYLLFRFFSWVLAWIIGATLWVIDQSFLVPEPPKEKIIPAVVGVFGWGFITLFPYFLYRWVDKKWSNKGVWKTILILFVIDSILFTFAAYQIFVLHRVFGNAHQNALPSKTCPERLIIEKDKPTTAYWNGKTLEVAGEDQNWVEQNCPGALQQP